MHKYYCQKHTYDYDTVIQFNFNDAIALVLLQRTWLVFVWQPFINIVQ